MWSDNFGMAAEFVVRDVLFVLRWIPPGTFWMGSPESELGRVSWEGPQHEVTISEGFWMGETPVTQAQWAAIVEAGMAKKLIIEDSGLKPKPSRFNDAKLDGRGDLPVDKVSWNQSTALCQVLEQLMENGPGFRLPTEAQWEYACRAGTQSAFNDGSDCTVPEGLDPALKQLGWFDKNSEGRTQFVKQKQPNRWGLYDMHGNVWEWCADAWLENVYARRKEGVIDPVEESNNDSASRVVRGGSWSLQALFCRAAFRLRWHPGFDWDYFGLRLSAGQRVTWAEPRGAERATTPKRRSRGGGT
jgi:formylglycine-generating enzyme required for sulfatase activity